MANDTHAGMTVGMRYFQEGNKEHNILGIYKNAPKFEGYPEAT